VRKLWESDAERKRPSAAAFNPLFSFQQLGEKEDGAHTRNETNPDTVAKLNFPLRQFPSLFIFGDEMGERASAMKCSCSVGPKADYAAPETAN
jgi:hypothetical protein